MANAYLPGILFRFDLGVRKAWKDRQAAPLVKMQRMRSAIRKAKSEENLRNDFSRARQPRTPNSGVQCCCV
jgi:hypothetical protein